MNTKLKGYSGEEFTCEILLLWGFKLLNRNFSCKLGEIDIIAYDEDILCFIEVRTKTSPIFVNPIETINLKKIKSIKRTAEYYILINNLFNIPVRFDIATIIWKNKEFSYFRNVF